jgi:HipA-like protein
MRQGNVYYNHELAGILTEQKDGSYTFHYVDTYFFNTKKPAISVTLSKNKQHYTSAFLFPFFYNMLSEGANKAIQCNLYRIDETDHFGLLLKTTADETVGAITVKEITI